MSLPLSPSLPPPRPVRSAVEMSWREVLEDIERGCDCLAIVKARVIVRHEQRMMPTVRDLLDPYLRTRSNDRTRRTALARLQPLLTRIIEDQILKLPYGDRNIDIAWQNAATEAQFEVDLYGTNITR